MFNDWPLDGANGRVIRLITPDELKELPSGTVLHDIFGNPTIVGQDPIDDDTRGGYLAFGHLLEEGE